MRRGRRPSVPLLPFALSKPGPEIVVTMTTTKMMAAVAGSPEKMLAVERLCSLGPALAREQRRRGRTDDDDDEQRQTRANGQQFGVKVMSEYVWALHDFTPEHDDEVPFRAGEQIQVIEKDELYGDGWWQVSGDE